jgi:uncharacterized membrane protein
MLASLMPTPLHPAVVHLPVALAVIAPVAALVALVAIRRGARPRPVWGVAVATLIALLGSGFLARETGEDEEETVERVVAESALDPHEEAADRFLIIAGAVTALAALGLAGGGVGRGARLAATAGTAAVVWAGYAVGHSGGQLTYQGGAAAAYADPVGTAVTPGGAPARAQDRDRR